jgi:HEAT repeat protein
MEANLKQVLHGFIQRANLASLDELESSFLDELVAGFETNPKEARRAMRKLLAHNNLKFFAAACQILKKGADTPGRDYLIKLLLEGDLLLVSLADVTLFSLDTAVALANVLLAFDPLLDFKLIRSLFQGDQVETGEMDTALAQRVLDVIAALPKHVRILPLLLKLLRVSNPRLRSKAVLLFCQVSKNLQWVERTLADEDPNVRASAIEGLWGSDTPGVRAILREAARDVDHHVAANALVGMYLLDGREAAPQLEQMAKHPAPLSRAAAASAMGRTADDSFIPLLNSLVKDYNAQVRSAAFRALVAIRRKGSPQQPPSVAAQPEAPGEPGEVPGLPAA